MSVEWRCLRCGGSRVGWHECPLAPPVWFTTWHPPMTTADQLQLMADTATGAELDTIAAWFGLHRTQQWAFNTQGGEVYQVEPDDVLRDRIHDQGRR